MSARDVLLTPYPDPVTLDQIYDILTSMEAPLEQKAYHLVTLNTVVFHPTVKLFLYEGFPTSMRRADVGKGGGEADDELRLSQNRLRREKIIKVIAFFLAQRNNAVSQECQWETVSLLGELCRMESTHCSDSGRTLTPTPSPPALLEAKLNQYAKLNLEYLARLPWLVPAIHAILGEEAVAAFNAAERKQRAEPPLPQDDGAADVAPAVGSRVGMEETKGGSSADAAAVATSAVAEAHAINTRAELKARLREKQNRSSVLLEKQKVTATTDQDVIIALQDLLRALPAVVSSPPGAAIWTRKNIEQAHDLMFLDASTSLHHLIPLVSRSCNTRCSQCFRFANALNPIHTVSDGQEGKMDEKEVFSRCSSCKAVYYCSTECQRAHWSTAHRAPCQSFKKKCESAVERYKTLNSDLKKSRRKSQGGGDAVFEVPLEPSLFFETRRFLYEHRDSSFSKVDFNDYFMKYTVRGT